MKVSSLQTTALVFGIAAGVLPWATAQSQSGPPDRVDFDGCSLIYPQKLDLTKYVWLIKTYVGSCKDGGLDGLAITFEELRGPNGVTRHAKREIWLSGIRQQHLASYHRRANGELLQIVGTDGTLIGASAIPTWARFITEADGTPVSEQIRTAAAESLSAANTARDAGPPSASSLSGSTGSRSADSAGALSPSGSTTAPSTASGGGCAGSTASLASRIPPLRQRELQQIRQEAVSTNIATVMRDAKRQGFSGEAAVKAALDQAREHDRVSRDALRTANEVDAFGTSDDAFYAALNGGTMQFSDCSGIRNASLCAAIANKIAAVSARAIAAAMQCHLRAGTWGQ